EMNLNGYSTFVRRAITMTASTAVVLFAIAIFSSMAQAATFHVTTTADNNNNSSPTVGSLRKAIIDANNNPGPDTIDFNIVGSGVHKITLTLALPVITDPVLIDGYTQPGAVQNALANNNNAQLMIQIAGAGSVVDGIVISAGSSTVKGLIITGFINPNSFGGSGIKLLTKGSNVIAGNFIGTDANGTNAIPNYVGIFANRDRKSV